MPSPSFCDSLVEVMKQEKSKALRVLVADDSPTFLAIIKDILSKFKSIDELRVVSSGMAAIEESRSFLPHLVFMDLKMPGINGLEALAKIREKDPEVDVVIISGAAEDSARLTIEAIKQGALDFVCKPSTRSLEEMEDYFLSRLAPFIRRAAHRSVFHYPEDEEAGASSSHSSVSMETQAPSPSIAGRVELVVIGVSTGAPKSLPELLSTLPRDLPVPILALVDVPKVFLRFLGRLLITNSSIAVAEASDGDRLSPSRVLVAHTSAGIRLQSQGGNLQTSIIQGEAKKGRLLDELLFSVAHTLDSGCLTAVLSGFGEDGLAGVERLRSLGGHYTLVQNPESATAPERPGRLIQNGLADEVLSLGDLGPRIVELVSPGAQNRSVK